MADQIFPKGIRLFDKKPTQPDFVIGAMVVTMDELNAFCIDNPTLMTEYNGNKQLKLQILRKKDGGGIYAAVDTWKPTPAAAAAIETPALPEDRNDLPF